MGVGDILDFSRPRNSRFSDLSCGRRIWSPVRADSRRHNHVLPTNASRANFLRRVPNENVASTPAPANSTVRSISWRQSILSELRRPGSIKRKILLTLRQAHLLETDYSSPSSGPMFPILSALCDNLAYPLSSEIFAKPTFLYDCIVGDLLFLGLDQVAAGN